MTEYGAYSPRKIYSTEDMKELVEYGRIRGVKVLPEFDAPAHVGNGWEWGPSQNMGNLAVCVNKEPWAEFCVEPPCGQLNPINENIYTVLGDLFKDFFDIFENDIFHMGGDEVHLNCWNSTEEITTWMTQNGMGVTKDDFLYLWSLFQNKTYAKVKEANNGVDMDTVLWTSELASKEHITKYLNSSQYIIQIWTNGQEEADIIPYLIENGYRTIFSNVDAWYLDCGYGAWIGSGSNNWCSPYKGWQQVYTNNPLQILANKTSQENADDAYANGLILGGEAPLWSEQVDEQSMEGKIWPRGAALAERLWTNPAENWYEAETRMIHHRNRIVERGLQADRIQPEWCYQNEKLCYG